MVPFGRRGGTGGIGGGKGGIGKEDCGGCEHLTETGGAAMGRLGRVGLVREAAEGDLGNEDVSFAGSRDPDWKVCGRCRSLSTAQCS